LPIFSRHLDVYDSGPGTAASLIDSPSTASATAAMNDRIDRMVIKFRDVLAETERLEP